MPRKKKGARGRAAKLLKEAQMKEKSPSPGLRNQSGRSRRATRSKLTYKEDADILDLQFTDPEIAVIESSSLVSSGSPPLRKIEEHPVRQNKRNPRTTKKKIYLKKESPKSSSVDNAIDSEEDIEGFISCDTNDDENTHGTPENRDLQEDEHSERFGKSLHLIATDETLTVDVEDIDECPDDEHEPGDSGDEPAVGGNVEGLPAIYNSDSSPSASQTDDHGTSSNKKLTRKNCCRKSSSEMEKGLESTKLSDDEAIKKSSSWNVDDDLGMSVLINDTSMVFQSECQSSNNNDFNAFCDHAKRDQEISENSFTDCAAGVTFTMENKLLRTSELLKSDVKEPPQDQCDESDAHFPSQSSNLNGGSLEEINNCTDSNERCAKVDDEALSTFSNEGHERENSVVNNNCNPISVKRSSSDTETASETELAESRLQALENTQTTDREVYCKDIITTTEEVPTKILEPVFKSPAGITRRQSSNSSSETHVSSFQQQEDSVNKRGQRKKTVKKAIATAKKLKNQKASTMLNHQKPCRSKKPDTPETSESGLSDIDKKCPSNDSNQVSIQESRPAPVEGELKSSGEGLSTDQSPSSTIVTESIKVSRNAKINAKSSIKKDCDEENEELSSEPEHEIPLRYRSSSDKPESKPDLGSPTSQIKIKKDSVHKKTRKISISKTESLPLNNGDVGKTPLKRKNASEGSYMPERDAESPEKSSSFPTYNNKKWIYNTEHRNFLYGDKKFVADRHDLTLVGRIHLWRIRTKLQLLQKFVPAEIDGRCCHCGVDTYKSYSVVDDEIYVRYQPVIVDMLIDTDDRQIGMYYSMEKSHPVLGYFPMTDPLFGQFQEFLKHMTIRAMTDTCQLTPRTSIKSDNESGSSAAVDQIESYITSVLEGIMIRPHWPQTTMMCLLEYPNLGLTKTGVKKDGNCAACVQKGKSGVGAFKIYFHGNCYDAETLTLTKTEGPPIPDNQFCYACPLTLKAIHRLVHYKYWVFISIRMQLQQLYEQLKPGSKYDARDVFDFITGDFQWIKQMFYEFQTITGEGIQAREKADRQDKAMEKKEKAAIAVNVRKAGKNKVKSSSNIKKTGMKNVKDSKSISNNSQSVARKLSTDVKRRASDEHSLSDQPQVKKNPKTYSRINSNETSGYPSFSNGSEKFTDLKLQLDSSVQAESSG